MIVHKNNRDSCEIAINRMRRTHPCDILFTGDIIAMLEEEVDGYRNKIRYLEKELKENTEESTLETEAAIEGIAVNDGIFYVSSGDTVLIKTQVRYTKEKIYELVDKLAKCGVGCIVLGPDMDVIGAIEHEKTD